MQLSPAAPTISVLVLEQPVGLAVISEVGSAVGSEVLAQSAVSVPAVQ